MPYASMDLRPIGGWLNRGRYSASGHFRRPEVIVNSNQVKGTAKDVAGKVQQKVGEATGSASQQIKGIGKQIEGKIRKGAGDAEEAAKDAERKSRS